MLALVLHRLSGLGARLDEVERQVRGLWATLRLTPAPSSGAPVAQPTPWPDSGAITVAVGTTAPIPTPPVDGGGVYYAVPTLPVNGLGLALKDAGGLTVAELATAALDDPPQTVRPLVRVSDGIPVSVELSGAGLGVTFRLYRP